ncbi:testis anion transporter 1 isoform X2 [Perognathus longimembris pacificus]|uniref:testis anion transporter 1 isoform X2 n=1 Tax=Perognathus longimembris pacificus TaxID=214514 RepID=UPI002018A4C6|nr:testis anion transporter 1 isoform X2 [Perognathus longimembris pacificus]
MMQAESSYKSRQNSFTYDVKRDVYNEENFQQEHRRRAPSSGNVDIDITTFKHHVQCHCSWHKFLRCMLTVFPFLEWMCLYRFKDWLLGDLLAGISVGLVQVPQGLTLSLLTRQLIPSLNVTYGAFCSSVIYVIFGSCHQMSIGPFLLVSALMIDVLSEAPFNNGNLIMGTFIKDDFSSSSFFINYNSSLSVVATTTFLTGIIQLGMGLLGMGFMATYLPEATINAYLAAVALHIMVSQLTCIFGIMISFHSGPISFFYNIVNYCIGLPKANSTSILLFLTAVVALRINKCIRISFNRYPIEFPMELFLILAFTVLSSKITMATETSRTLIEMIPFSFIPPVTPDFSILSKIIFQAISLSLVSAFLLIFTGKKIANLHNYKVNSNQDLIAIGLCNVVSSFFKSCVFTGALARTIIQDKSGGRQQFASLVGAGVMLLLMVKVGSFFYELPNVIWMVTFSAAIFLGLDIGLFVSLIFTFFIITVRSHRTKILLLGQIPDTNIYRSSNDYREVILIPGIKIFQFCNSITYVNVYHIKQKLLNELDLVRVPLKEEEIFMLFNESDSGTNLHDNHLCKCFCDCEELQPPPRILYLERFENKLGSDASSVNLVRCSYFESMNTSESSSEDQVPYTISSTSQRYPEQNYEEVDKPWLSSYSRQNSIPLPDSNSESVERSKSIIPYSESSFQPGTHTIILDFSMVHYVDSRASIVLRQMCNAFRNASILVLIAGCHSSVIRAFERNDFFDDGITKAQFFLSLHDAVLSAVTRKLMESELSIDESEMVIQETYSESDKNDKSRYKMSGSSLPEVPRSGTYDFTKPQEPIDEEFDLDLEPISESDTNRLELTLDMDQELESEVPESEMEADTEPETQAELEPELQQEPQPEDVYLDLLRERRPDPKSKPKSPIYSQWQYWSDYQPAGPRSSSQIKPRTQPVDRKQQNTGFHS